MSGCFKTGLEPILEKLAAAQQLSLNLPRPEPRQLHLDFGAAPTAATAAASTQAAPSLLSRASSSMASGGRALANAARSGGQRALNALGAVPRAVKGGLGAAALLGAGGLAYGALRQNDEDAKHLPQMYAPMTGSIYG